MKRDITLSADIFSNKHFAMDEKFTYILVALPLVCIKSRLYFKYIRPIMYRYHIVYYLVLFARPDKETFYILNYVFNHPRRIHFPRHYSVFIINIAKATNN